MKFLTEYIVLDGSRESLRGAINERDSGQKGVLHYLLYTMQSTGLSNIVLKTKGGWGVELLMHDISWEHLQVLEGQLQRLAGIYYGSRWLDLSRVIRIEAFPQRHVLTRFESIQPQGDGAVLDKMKYSPEEIESLIYFNSLVLDELRQLFDLCMKFSELGTDMVLHQSEEYFEQFTLYVHCEESENVVAAILRNLNNLGLLKVEVCYGNTGMTESDYGNVFVKYTKEGAVYCCRDNITVGLQGLKVGDVPEYPGVNAFQDLLRKHGFAIWKEQEILSFAGKSKELALACMIRGCLDLPYVVLKKTGDNYAAIGLPITDTAVLRVLNTLYSDLKYGIFGESDVYDEEATCSEILGINKSKMYDERNCFYGHSYGFGWYDTDYVITEEKWYYRDAPKDDLGKEAQSLLRTALQKEVSEYTGYMVQLSDAMYLVEFFIAYQKLIPMLQEISYHSGMLVTKLYHDESVLRTDIYVRDTDLQNVQAALEEARDIADEVQYLHCQVKSLNAFVADYRAYTECYAGGMVYRIMDTEF